MERVGRYQLVRKLATGGMAEVFLAKAEGPGGFEKNLVVKRILPHLAERPQFVQMFLAEARIAAQLDHPNIVQIFDFGESEGAYFLAMEWVDGANLRGLNKWSLGSGEYLPLPLVARMVAQAAEGLAYAHDFADPESGRPLNLIHRDVSGENVLVGKTGAVKVLDFGIAKVSGEGNGTRVGALKGKLGYMPPEQVKGLPLDRRADVYALGVVLYQLLTGRKPYDQKGDIPLIAAILHEPPVPLLTRRPDLPPELVAVVEKAMAREKEARFADCREMQAALERFVARSAEPVTSQQLGQLVARCLAASAPAGASPSRTGSRSGVSPTPTPKPAPSPLLTPAVPVASSEETLANDADEEDDAPLPPAPQVARPAQPPGLEVVSSMEFMQWQAEASAVAPAGLPLDDDAPLELAATSDLQDASTPPLGVPALPMPVTLPRPEPITPSSVAYLSSPTPASLPRPLAAPSFASSPTPVCMPRPAARLPTPAAVPPVPVAPAGPELSGAPLAYRPCSAAPEPLQQAVRQTAQADRSLHLVRRFPGVAARILEGCRDVPAPLAESLGAVLDAALLADDHAAVRRILDQALTTPGGRWAALVRGELAHPLRLAWLAERLRYDVPRDPGSLKAWLTRLGSAPALLWLIDELDPGPAQDLVCEALAPFVAAEPALVASRLDATPAPRNAGALWYVLEKADWKDRGRLLQKLMQRREPALQVALMGARARAGSQDAASLVACAVGERSEELRRCALRLLADMDDDRLVGMLTSQMQGPAFEGRPAEERVAYWAALGAVGRPGSLAFVEQTLAQKTTVLNRKKSLEAKLPALEALVEMRGDAPARALERLVQDRSQPDELSAAARQALDRRRFRKGTSAGADAQKGPDRRLRLLRGLGLDLALLVRATGAVDLSTGVLDAALDRFRESVRQALLADGRFKLLVVPGGLEFNGAPVDFASPGAPLGPLVAQALQSRDFRGFAVEAPVPSPELRAMLLRLLDPDGEGERLSHARVATFSGRALGPVPEPAAAADPAARARALHAHAVHLVRRHREALKAGRQILLAEARPLLDEWSRLYVAGNAGFLGLLPASPGDVPDLHPPNAAVVSMAFAADLGLGRAHLRECAELALFHDLTLFNVPPERHPAPGTAVPEDLRLRLAWLLLAQNRSRRGPTYAVAAWESGLEPSTDESTSPGVAASVFALADTWDALTVGARHTPAQALEAIQGRLRRRFHPQLLPLFARWAAVQSGLAAS